LFEFFRHLFSRSRSPSKQGSEDEPHSERKWLPDFLADPLASTDVVEGNSETDWALWEDSVTMLDSQMQALQSRSSSSDNFPRTTPGDMDAFSAVRKRDR
jgi:hypothetical protein